MPQHPLSEQHKTAPQRSTGRCDFRRGRQRASRPEQTGRLKATGHSPSQVDYHTVQDNFAGKDRLVQASHGSTSQMRSTGAAGFDHIADDPRE